MTRGEVDDVQIFCQMGRYLNGTGGERILNCEYCSGTLRSLEYLADRVFQSAQTALYTEALQSQFGVLIYYLL